MKIFARHFGLVLILIAGLFFTAGCGAWLMKSSYAADSNQRPNPFAGWRSLGLNSNSVDKPIQNDYLAFIQTLSLNQVEPKIGEIWFYENEEGQHGVSIQVFSNNKPTVCYYALFYSKGDKRIKVIKYASGGYQS